MAGQPDLFAPDPFADAVGAPDGFHLQAGVLSIPEERDLLSRLGRLDYRPFRFRGFEGLRRTVYFGWRYDFDAGRLERAEPFPNFLLAVRDRAASFAGLAAAQLEHVLITHYPAGAPIGWHRDRPQFQEVVGISLGAPVTFRMRRKHGDAWRRWSTALEPRSIYRLSGEARRIWEHSIPPAPAERYSITFRTLAGRPSGARGG